MWLVWWIIFLWWVSKLSKRYDYLGLSQNWSTSNEPIWLENYKGWFLYIHLFPLASVNANKFDDSQNYKNVKQVWALTHWGRDKVAAIFLTTFSNASSWMKMYEFHLRIHWNVFGRFELTIFHHWFRKWLGADQATSHYLSQWWLAYWCICASLGLNELTLIAFIVRKNYTLMKLVIKR